MNITYEEVPNIITSKDLDYLNDMFNFNYGAFKSNYNAIESIQDETLRSLVKKCSDVFYDNMDKILNILSNGGINE
ncbi:MAG: hypothetical protein Q4E75_05670 [bacterium]|nr:hypothetical protein [bacterium]